MAGNIHFYSKNKSKVSNLIKSNLKKAVVAICKDCGLDLSSLSVIMVSDEQLLEINRQYLNHDFYTDIISFDQAEEDGTMEGELYISTDRIKDNAITYGEKEEKEFCRVVIHGALHLAGYGDKTKKQTLLMREKENEYLTLCGY